MRLLLTPRGQVILMLALLLVVILAVAGLAVDVGLAYGVKARLASAADAAAIAALTERTTASGTDASAVNVATDFFNANFPAREIGVPQPTCQVEITSQKGCFVASVRASTETPTRFAKLIGWRTLTVNAKSEATRSDLDVALVLDTTKSLEKVFGDVQTAATGFVSRFNETYDRLALVPFASGVGVKDSGGELVLTDGVEIRNSARGFSRETLKRAISRLEASGYTDSEFGVRMGLYQLDKISNPAARRAIVFFSDGAPNIFTGNFPVDGGGKIVSGSLYSQTDEDDGPPTTLNTPNERHDKKPKKVKLHRLPKSGGGNYIGSVQVLPELPVTSKNRPISFDDKGAKGLKCNANAAARNLLENIAEYARSQGVVIYSLGYGHNLDGPEVKNCENIKESGSTIMRRVANTPDSDTYNPAQPAGIYCRAPTPDRLGPCFDAIANDLLRLTK